MRLVGGLGRDVDLLEVAEPLHAGLAVLDHRGGVHVALVDRELAPHHPVQGARVAVQVDGLDEVELALLYLEQAVDGELLRVDLGARIHAGVVEAAVAVEGAQPVDVGGELRAAEHVARLLLDERDQLVAVHRVVAQHVDDSDVVLGALGDVDGDGDPLVGHLDLGLADLDADVAVVHVETLDLVEVLVEDRLGVEARVVPHLCHPRGEGPGLGLHDLLELPRGERLVAREVDRAKLQLLALDHLEVHADRALALGLEVVADLGLVVALGLVLGLDPLRVLDQERVVDRRADRDRQLVLDVVGGNLLVAGDADLADHRVLGDDEGDDHARRLVLELDPHVVEEPEPVDAPDVVGQVRLGELLAHLGAEHRLDGVGLDAPVPVDPDLANDLARGDRRFRRRLARRRGEIERTLRRGLRVLGVGTGRERGEQRAQRGAAPGAKRLCAEVIVQGDAPLRRGAAVYPEERLIWSSSLACGSLRAATVPTADRGPMSRGGPRSGRPSLGSRGALATAYETSRPSTR